MAVPVQIRRGSKATWERRNTVLLDGQFGLERPSTAGGKPKLKVGDGVTGWNDLAYIFDGTTGTGGSDFVMPSDLPDQNTSILGYGSTAEFVQAMAQYTKRNYLGVAASQADMLLLNGAKGDWCTRSDKNNATYELIQPGASSLTNWAPLADLDAVFQAIAARALPAAVVAKSGDTMTGLLTLSGNPTSALHAVPKQYADSLAANLGKRGRCVAATTGNVTIATALNAGDVVDSVTLVNGDQVLVWKQTAPAENGVWVVGATPVRAAEFDTFDEHPGSLISVTGGATNGDKVYLCTANIGGTLGTTAITFDLFQSGGVARTWRGAVADQTAMLALTAVPGDWCVRSDLNTPWELIASPAGTIANWREYTAAPGLKKLNTQTGTAYTLQASDHGKVVAMFNAAANVVTVPATGTLPQGFECEVIQAGAGVTTIAKDASMTIEAPGSTPLAYQERFERRILTVTSLTNVRMTRYGGSSTAGSGIGMVWDKSATTDADPGAGYIRPSDAAQNSASVLYIDDVDSGGASLSGIFSLLGQGDKLTVRQNNDALKWVTYQVEGVDYATGYKRVFVVPAATGAEIDAGAIVRLTFDFNAQSGYLGSLGGPIEAATYNSDGSLATGKINGRTWAFGYVNGQLATETHGNQTRTYQRDARGRETSVTGFFERIGRIPLPGYPIYSGFATKSDADANWADCLTLPGLLGGEFLPDDEVWFQLRAHITGAQPNVDKQWRIVVGTTVLFESWATTSAAGMFVGVGGFEFMNSLAQQAAFYSVPTGFGARTGTPPADTTLNFALAQTMKLQIRFATAGAGTATFAPRSLRAWIHRGGK